MLLLYFIFLIIIVAVNCIEAYTYPNFVYSHLQIPPDRINALFGLLTVGYLFPVIRRERLQVAIMIATLLLVWITAAAIPVIAGKSLARIGLTATRQDWSLERKYRAVWGDRADFFRFVKTTTPETAKILIPLEVLPWRYTGNSQFLGAWLYPRMVVTTSRKNFLKTYPNYDYLLISSETDGAPQNIWPDFPVRAEKIIIYDWATGQGMEYSGIDWDPVDWRDQSPWGLIIPKEL